jgi:hypothetical protein
MAEIVEAETTPIFFCQYSHLQRRRRQIILRHDGTRARLTAMQLAILLWPLLPHLVFLQHLFHPVFKSDYGKNAVHPMQLSLHLRGNGPAYSVCNRIGFIPTGTVPLME